MEDEVDLMTGLRYGRGAEKEFQRWGHEDGSVVINGQKVAGSATARARGEEGDVKIGGSYELFRRDEDQQKRIWDAITRGLTTRGYGRESEQAFAIEKSAGERKVHRDERAEGERTAQKRPVEVAPVRSVAGRRGGQAATPGNCVGHR